MKARLIARSWAWQCQSCRFPLQSLSTSTTLPIRSFSNSLHRRADEHKQPQQQQQVKPQEEGGPINAAPPIDFDATTDAEKLEDDRLKFARIVPASPSYFTARPQFVDASLQLQALYRRYQHLPTVSAAAAPRSSWLKLSDFRNSVGEPVKAAKYRSILTLLKRLNRIHPSLVPDEVSRELAKHRRLLDSSLSTDSTQTLDENGCARGAGRRKSSSARVLLVEGEGEVLINGRSINTAFGRIHDRESALWALKATGRLDKYNVWALVQGGGTTGQAEAITLALAKALLVHEPALKPVLRRAGVVTRDPRRVERKKPGRLKARKKPAWVKR